MGVVVLGGELAPEGRAMLDAAGLAVVETGPYLDAGAVQAVLAAHRPEAVIVRLLAQRLDGAAMARAPELKLIAKHGVGTDDIDIAAARALGIPVAVAAGANGHSVAEHALGLILALVKDFARQDELIRAGTWDKGLYHGRELRGQRLGLVGLGFIGGTLARMAAAIGMDVVAFDPYAPDGAFGETVRREADLDRLLAESDVVSLHCPLTEATRNLIDKRRLGLMRRGAYLVNTARGEVVDEAALADALWSGHLAGAGLDSLAQEPPAPDNPLLVLPNVIVTPHVAGVTLDAKRQVSIISAQSVIDVLAGRPLAPRFLVRAA